MNYWESKFSIGGPVWGFEPSDSAIEAVGLFRNNGIENILIPGFGYGRNAKLFIDSGFRVTGIEISGAAVKTAREYGVNCQVHIGSVTSMPFDNVIYDGVYCYALIHLLNKPERRRFLTSCFRQLKDDGLMIFIVTSKMMDMYGRGRLVGKERYETEPGLRVFFYDEASVESEFSEFGLSEYREIDEPVKFMDGITPLKMWFVMCRK